MEQLVVGFDGSDAAAEALRWAADEAGRRGWAVRVVQSWREPVFGGQQWIDLWEDPGGPEREAFADLKASVESVASTHPGVEFATSWVEDRPDRALIDASEGAAMVVVGARGRGGFTSLLLGSVSQRVANEAPTTVVVVRGVGRTEGDVVVGIDGSEPTRQALEWAADTARVRSSRLLVVMAWSYLSPAGPHGPEPFRSDYTEDDAMAAAHKVVGEVLGPDPGIELKVEAPCELPAKALLERGADAGLLVVGSRGASGASRLGLGSVTMQVLHHATCPLAVVRGPRR